MITKPALILAFMMFSHTAAAEEYDFVTAGKISATYVDALSVRVGEEFNSVRTTTFYFEPYKLGNRITDFSISETEVRCATGEFRFTAAVGYNADGERISHMTASTQWFASQAAPNFVKLVQITCDPNVRGHDKLMDLRPTDALAYVRNSRRTGLL